MYARSPRDEHQLTRFSTVHFTQHEVELGPFPTLEEAAVDEHHQID